MTKKKKVAMFATGWLGEILHEYIAGIRDGFKAHDADVDMYIFMCYARFSNSEEYMQGELNIIDLPDIEDFDAVFIFANSLDFNSILSKIVTKCHKAKIPVFSTGGIIDGCYFVGSENRNGMQIMCNHLFDEHNVKSVWFIAGSKDNMDSNQRLDIVKNSMYSRGLTFNECDVCYSNWEPNNGKAFVSNRLNQRQQLPDAIICANDTLAMVLCGELRDRGINVPSDCIITGFDNEYYAQIYDPSISSINQRFDQIGREIAKSAKDFWDGQKLESEKYIPCEFVPSESCGCTSARDFLSIRKEVARNKFHEKINLSNFDLDLALIEREINKGKNYEDLKKNFDKLYSGFNNFEGDSFHILLDPLYKETVTNTSKRFRTSGYPKKMDIVFSMDKAKKLDATKFDTSKLVPTSSSEPGRSFIFLPLHEEDKVLGYIVFCDDIEKIKNAQTLRKYAERINIILIKYHKDLCMEQMHQRLLEMTETDGLTHVKNRAAFELKITSMQNTLDSGNRLSFGIVVFDVNNLKKINDQYGHKAGDEYIVNACTLVCKTYKHSAVYRIGGDEFVVILENDDYKSRDRLLSSFSKKMEKLQASDLPLTSKISIASGMATFKPKMDMQITDVFKRADAKMYENKSIMKANNKTLQF